MGSLNYNISYWHLPQLSKDEGVKDTGYSMSIKNLILSVNSVTASYCLHYERGKGSPKK